MSINALVMVNDGTLKAVVDVEPVIDATCDAVLIETVAAGGLGNKDVLREFLSDLDSPKLKDLLDYADFSHQDIVLEFMGSSLPKYLRKNRPGVVELARTNLLAALAIHDYTAAAAICYRYYWQHQRIAAMSGGILFILLIVLGNADGLWWWRWGIVFLCGLALGNSQRSSYLAGLYRAKAQVCDGSRRGQEHEDRLATRGLEDYDDEE